MEDSALLLPRNIWRRSDGAMVSFDERSEVIPPPGAREGLFTIPIGDGEFQTACLDPRPPPILEAGDKIFRLNSGVDEEN